MTRRQHCQQQSRERLTVHLQAHVTWYTLQLYNKSADPGDKLELVREVGDNGPAVCLAYTEFHIFIFETGDTATKLFSSLLIFLGVQDDIKSSSGISFQMRVENHIIKSLLLPRASKLRCLQKCADLPKCFSVNYHATDRICELNHYNYMLSDPSAAAGYVWYDCC